MAGQPAPDFAALLRQLRAESGLTQEELAAAAGLSPRTVSDLERGIHRLAHQDTARLLGDALGLTGPVRGLFVAAARGHASAEEVLAARSGVPRDAARLAGRQADVEQLLGAVVGSPYRGLKAFEEQDAAFFFGREAATTALLERMSRLLADAGLLVVSGVSGAGKSSLLRAGMLPRLRKAGLAAAPEAASWPCLVFTPTRAPLDELALRVGVVAGADAATVRRGLEADPAGFALTTRQAALAQLSRPAGDVPGAPDQPSQERLLLVVDQFEELFTQCADDGQRRAFIAALHAAATAGHGPDEAPAALVVLGVRADFEARCADYPQLAGAVQDRYLVTSMTERQLRMAIAEPARKAGSQVADDLVDSLLSEARAGQHGTFGAGKLPLLSHALDQAWRSRTGNTVTLADYERTGGIEGAVGTSAQRTYDALTPAQQVTARQVFTRLAATTIDGVDTTDRATRMELTFGKDSAGIRDVEVVLEAFTAERLLTLSAGTVEISHEVLLTAWPLLCDTWLADTHADRIVRTRLVTSAAEWDRHSRDPSYLYGGSRLQAATDTASRITADPLRHSPLGQTERDFLYASQHAHLRTTHGRQAVIACILALTLAAMTATVFAVHSAAVAGQQHALSLSRLLAGESIAAGPTGPVIARQLAVAAWGIYPTGQADSLMGTLLTEQAKSRIMPALDGTPNSVDRVAFSPRGNVLAGAGADGTLRLLKLAAGQPIGQPVSLPTHGGVHAITFSPGGSLLASADGTGIVQLWETSAGQHTGTAFQTDTGVKGGVAAIGFRPDGKLLAVVGADGRVQLWDPFIGKSVGRPIPAATGPGGMVAVAFSPDRKLLAIGGNGTVRLWDPFTGKSVGRPVPAATGPGGHVVAVAFSPDRNLVAVADADGTVRLWNPFFGQPAGPLIPTGTGPSGGVRGVAFSPGGGLIATAGANGTLRMWNPFTGQPVGAPILVGTGRYGGVDAVTFSPHGGLLASADADGTVRLWNVSLFVHPYAALCADAEPMTRQDWHRYAPGEPQPRICA